MVSTSRCGRDNPGSNPGYSNLFLISSKVGKKMQKSVKSATRFNLLQGKDFELVLDDRHKSVQSKQKEAFQ